MFNSKIRLVPHIHCICVECHTYLNWYILHTIIETLSRAKSFSFQEIGRKKEESLRNAEFPNNPAFDTPTHPNRYGVWVFVVSRFEEKKIFFFVFRFLLSVNEFVQRDRERG